MFLEALLSIGLLIVVAKLAEGIFSRIGLNSIIAYTATGILLGPVTKLVHPSGEQHLFLSVGVFILFFMIGFDEIDIKSFVSTIRGRFFVAATISVLISLFAALTITSDIFFDFGLGFSFTTALAIAGILSISSLGLVAKVLADGGHLKDPVGIRIFTTAIIAELLALLVVGFTIGEHTHELSVLGVLRLLGQIVGFAVVAWLLSAKVMPPLMIQIQKVLNVPQLYFGILMGGLFLLVVAAEKIGLHGSLGALLFGAALSGLPARVRRDIIPGLRTTAEGLFVPLFFAAAGLHFSVQFLDLPVWTILALVAVPFFGKFLGAFLGAYLARIEAPFAIATGLMAKGVAEIALLLVLLETGLISKEIFSLLILVMFGYILLMPSLIRFAVNRVKARDDTSLPESAPPSLNRYALENVTASQIIDKTREYPTPDLSVSEFLGRWIVPNQQHYVVVEEGNVQGIVSVARTRALPDEASDKTPLRTVLRHHTPEAWSDDHIDVVLERMTASSLTVIPVTERMTGRFLGTITSNDLLKVIAGTD